VRFSGERAVVVGAGVAGAGAARALLEEGADVLVTEVAPDTDGIADLRALGVDVLAGGHDASHLDGASFVVASPGVPPDAPILAWARERSIPIWSELELGARLADAPLIAVTGTNGKTTTTGMIGSMLRASGADAVECGNVGRSFPLAAREGHDVLVVECSSFQLLFQESFHPAVSVLLNLAPDHLDWHGMFEAYRDAKSRIYARQGPGDVHVGNRDDPEAAAISARAPCDVVWFTVGSPGEDEIGYEEGRRLVARTGGVQSLGEVDGARAGYRSDAAAAAASAIAFGVAPDAVERGLASFSPAAHRGDPVAEIGRAHV